MRTGIAVILAALTFAEVCRAEEADTTEAVEKSKSRPRVAAPT